MMTTILWIWASGHLAYLALFGNVELGPESMDQPAMDGPVENTAAPILSTKRNWPIQNKEKAIAFEG